MHVNRVEHSLPPPPRTFIGREQELAGLEAWWHHGDERLAFVRGPAGIGKSALLRRLAYRVNAPVTWRTLAVAYGTLDRWRSSKKRPLPSGVQSLLLIDEVDKGGLEMLNRTVREINAVSPSTRILAAGRVAPSDRIWHRLELGPMPTEDVRTLLDARVGAVNGEVIQRIASLIKGSPLLAQVVIARLLMSGPRVVDEILSGLDLDEGSLLDD